MSDETVTLERLADYLDSGRIPYDPSIEEVPENAGQLAVLQRLRALSSRLVADEGTQESLADPSWFGGVMERVRREARSGRDIPLVSSDLQSTLHLTEGAVRGLIREAGDSVPGAVVISCGLDGPLAEPGAPIHVEVTISALRGIFVPAMADEVREAVATRLLAQTELVVDSVDVIVGDVHQLGGGAA
ncbi:hypothetical protein EDF46_1631 [Frondihabitans sp. PhB188]|uniref:Asp23/Gls24 family envelope stress response protein n=1 Tax=Frondihabitans sp. PhB188 TaxID=2485200 RepID=UPI000F46F16E|nr:Asp23/Gls24 family envelope stress response protein [Frondihabitans sp. PhB188]ROQ39996.1 hypothetical protein EDF46_1631 [Frondihabitans sp. PhB188]